MLPSTEAPNGIGTLKESSLHAGLKDWYAQPGDKLESPVDGYWIDLVRERLLIEIQTGSFSAIKPKLTRLLKNYPVRLVYPITREKWIVRVTGDGRTIGRKRYGAMMVGVVDGTSIGALRIDAYSLW
jgi:hypothetical protein